MSDDTPRNQTLVDTVAADDLRLYSVTSILKASTSSEGLNYWGKQQVALAAVNNRSVVDAMLKDAGTEAAVEWLMDAPYRRPRGQRSAAELGTAVHAACEDYALTGERPQVDDEVKPFLDQFDRWAQQFQPEYLAAEMTVFHPEYGYAGTCDAFLALDGMPLIADYKTSKKSVDKKGNPTKPYAEVGLQLAAYRYAEFAAAVRVRRFEQLRRRYYVCGDEERSVAVAIPAVEGGVAIHITPDHCNAHIIRCDEPVFEQWLYMVEASRWEFEMAKTIVGEPLRPPGRSTP